MGVDIHAGNVRSEFQKAYSVAMRTNGGDDLLREHVEAWQSTWDDGYVHLSGTDLQERQIAIFSQFYLISSMPSMHAELGLGDADVSTVSCHRAYHPHGSLARYVKLRVEHALGMPGTFSPPPPVSDSDMHQGTCVTHMPWCMLGSLTSSFLWSLWWGKYSQHSQSMCNPQFYVSGKRPMDCCSGAWITKTNLCWYPW